MKFNFKRTAIAATISCLALVSTASADCVGGASTTSAVRLRSGAGTHYSVLDTLNPGTKVIVEKGLGSGWYQVNHQGQRGYMSANYMNLQEQLTLSATGYINGAGVRLRSGPGTDSDILGTYNPGAAFEITGVHGDWYRVSGNGGTGYVNSKYMVLSEGEITALQTPPGEKVVELAKQYLGYKYVWGGSTPSSGFDCSGYVSYVMQSLGYETNRTAADIYRNGTYVEKEDLKTGDAVFFGSSSNYIGHIGIYIGDGEFIHSSSGQGKVVISELEASYYARNYVGARRIAV